MAMITFGSSYEKKDDLALDQNGLLILFQDKNALELKLFERLKLFFGEFFADTTRGMPYINNILGANVNIDLASSIITQEILKEEQIMSVFDVNFILNSGTRIFTYSAKIVTIYTTTDFNFTNG